MMATGNRITGEASMAKFGLSQSVRRVEDPRLLTGNGRYTDDIAMDGQAHGVVLRSPHAHARITALDTAPALAIPGVPTSAAVAPAMAASGTGANTRFHHGCAWPARHTRWWSASHARQRPDRQTQ